ncbi:MAG TPA: pyridoxal phosphate-dependent aminotransferase [Candidatus Angelobacter sp.]
MFADRTNWNLTPNRLSEALDRHRASGRTLLDLSASNPTECGFQYASHAIMRALCSPRTIEYRPDPNGLEIARRAVSNYYAEKNRRVLLDKTVLTTSTSEGYSFILRLICNPGDELLVPTPSYPLFDFLAEIQDVRLKRYPLIYDHGWQIDLHALEQEITERTRGVIVVHPNNPTGQFTKAGEMDFINRLCVRRGMAIIADEVFLDFPLAPEAPLSFCANQEALTFTMSGLSKISGLPQMKLAWIVVSGPEDLKHQAMARLELIADTYLSLNAPVQLAAPVFLEMRHGFQQQVMQRLRANLAELDRQLAAQPHCSRLEVEGGWYAVVRVPATGSDEDLALELLEQKNVYVHPGHFYDFQQEGHLVVSLITPESEFAEGVQRLLAMDSH